MTGISPLCINLSKPEILIMPWCESMPEYGGLRFLAEARRPHTERYFNNALPRAHWADVPSKPPRRGRPLRRSDHTGDFRKTMFTAFGAESLTSGKQFLLIHASVGGMNAMLFYSLSAHTLHGDRTRCITSRGT
jgi:hypothetical protein